MNSVRDWGCWWFACFLAASAQATPDDAFPAPWLEQAQQSLQQREYRASATAHGLQAPNRAQGFRTHFSAEGVSLVTRDAEAAPLLGLRLLDYGRQQSRQATGGAEVVSEGARVTMRWPGVEARYDNRTDGLAQQLLLGSRPFGEGVLTLTFAIGGTSPRLEGNAVTLPGTSQALRWDRFAARDAEGRVIPVALAAGADRLTLTLDDRNARYPIAIDSMLGGLADAQFESNQAGANLGASVAGAGDINGDGFADVVVGAPFYDNGQADEGAAFVYFGGAGAFDTSADAHLEMDQAMALFGTDIAGAGDVNGDGFDDVIVGAPSYDGGQPFEGAAFIYFGGAGAFDLVRDAHLEANRANSQFGFSVAGAGDVDGDGFDDVVVGARSYTNGQSVEGAAYVYFGGAGAFDLAADAQVESNQTLAQMGVSVASAGDVNGDGFDDVAIGAFRYANGEFNEGAAFLYFGGPGAFDLVADAQLESNQEGAVAGLSVAGAGDVNGDGFDDVIVGVPGLEVNGIVSGGAFLYFGGAGAFDPTVDARLESNQSAARLGNNVAGAGDVNGDGYNDVILAAADHDNGETDEGAAFVYLGGPGGFDLIADAHFEADQANAQFGTGVGGAGDVNGDGLDDMIVGARLYANGQVDEGAAFIYYGVATGPADLIFANGFE